MPRAKKEFRWGTRCPECLQSIALGLEDDPDRRIGQHLRNGECDYRRRMGMYEGMVFEKPAPPAEKKQERYQRKGYNR